MTRQEQPQENLGEEIRRAREARNWTPEQLAVYAGLSGVTIRAVETGRTRPFKSTLMKIRAALQRDDISPRS